ncbi:family 16 glycoside hydrolase [Bremerella sp.]|uniref:family 16 glycoside hydrolase n=1 Tax=Bremerella sp. TaxID=2795602 RepID=UPI00391A8583
MRIPTLLAVLLSVGVCCQAYADDKNRSGSSAADAATEAGTTKGIVDFMRPASAVQLVGEAGSILVPESHYECQWTFQDGVLTASPKWDSVVTPDAYQDFRMHVEFNINDAGDVEREKNGNSGVYIQQRYELQILNSFGVSQEEYTKRDCGCLYGMKTPDKLVCKPAGQWQSFDIAFRAARFDGARKVENARITVYQNEELIHDDVVLPRNTGAGKKEEHSARPIKLQGHHNQVQFRNVWIQDLSLAQNDQAGALPRITASRKTLPLQGETFQLNGADAFVILPKGGRNAKEAIPWVWYAPTLEGLPSQAEKWMFERFLESGIAIAGIDVGESYGSPSGRTQYTDFYDYLVTSRKFGQKPCLLARSRGGLMLYSWAASHPQAVSGIAGIYPVCNIASYPGIDRASGAYELTADQLTAELTDHNPIDRLAPLAKANVPIFHLHGDQDQVVPLEENSALVEQRYQQLGGDIDLEVVTGQGHNMWNGWFQSEKLVAFVCNCLGRPIHTHPVPESDLWLTYPGGEGPGKGKHIVLIAADQEYRSEQSMPMLAKILSQRHGFDCTVLFGMNAKGQVDPTMPVYPKKGEEDAFQEHSIPGLEHLAKADLVILFSRLLTLPPDQAQHLADYLDSGKPIIGLRTANHGFRRPLPYKIDGKQVHIGQVLGGTFLGHHGNWHRDSTRGDLVPEMKDHPIVKGVNEIWGPSDVYRTYKEGEALPGDCTALVMGQPLLGRERGGESNPEKEPLPVAWFKDWQTSQGKTARVFQSTMGSGKDFESAGLRRLVINAAYWCLGMEDAIEAASSVDYVGPYKPLASGFNYEELGVTAKKPAEFK